MAYTRPAAPGSLEPIEAFCNSARFLYGEDAFADLPSARAWLRGRGWSAAANALDEPGLRRLYRVREAIRDHIADPGAKDARTVLNDHARAVLKAPQWAPSGEALIPVAAQEGIDTLIGALLSTLAVEELAGRRARLKVCRSPQCRWLYYDRSPGNNSVWCSMNICGARHKMRSYRGRRGDGAPAQTPPDRPAERD